MNNGYHFIKDIKRISALLVICILCFAYGDVGAQSVNISVNITPPYSPFYSDYSGANASKVFLTLQNLTNATKNIKLTGQLEGDNGIRITTKSNYVPLQPIVLNPNQVRQLNGLALKDIFDLNTLNVYGVDKVKLVQTSRLPEGNYTFCIQAVDMATNQVISATAPLGCTTISITYPDAPILISPATNFSVLATTPQSVVFNWINAGFAPVGTQYILQVAEMPLRATDPNQILNSVSFPLINRTLSGFSYVMSPADPPLVVGKNYAWRVKAIDPSGRVVFKNNGISLANTFTYNNPPVYANAPNLISPVANAKITATSPQNIYFNWATETSLNVNTNISLNLNTTTNTNKKYNFQLVELANSSANPVQAFNTGNFVINKNIVQLSYALSNIDPQLKVGKSYAWRVRAFDETGKTLYKNNGLSQISVFEYSNLTNSEGLPLAPIITTPKMATVVNQANDFTQPNINISWAPSNTPTKPTYEVRIAKLIPGFDAQTAFDNNVQVVLSYQQSGNSFTLSSPLANENLALAKNAGRIKLAEDSTYAIQIVATAYTANRELIMIENFGKSNIVQFKYKGVPKPTPTPNTPITSTIAGKFFYRFKAENEQPVQRPLGFAQVTTNLYNNLYINSTTDNVKYEDYPDVVASGRFGFTGTEKPLKNVKIDFTYTLLESNTKNPKTYADVKPVGNLNSNYIEGKY
ncbi:MAG: hypothetical protein EOO42_10955, partial [Flavobacteriales bacterium]